jgi:hypothetical protein
LKNETGCFSCSPLLHRIDASAGHGGNRMKFIALEVVASNGPIRETNQDSAAASRRGRFMRIPGPP